MTRPRAREILDRIAEMFPARTDVALRRAQVALALGEHDEALMHVADAIDRAAASGNKEEMIVASEVYAGCFPREPLVRFSHVLLLLTARENEKAAESFAIATRLLATSYPNIRPPTFDHASIEAVVKLLSTQAAPQN